MSVKKIFTIFFLLFLFSPIAFSQSELRIGEKLRYRVHFGPFTLGYAEMSILGTKVYNGVECLILQSTAKNTDFLAEMYPVNDKITSYWDPINKRILWNEKDISEGDYRRKYEVSFDYEKRTATWQQSEHSDAEPDEKNEGVVKDIPLIFQDFLSSVYYSRVHPAAGKVGDTFYMNVFDDTLDTKAKVDVLRKEVITVRIDGEKKKMKTFVVNPQHSTTGIFRSKGKLIVWISDDENRWPLRISSSIGVGAIFADLIGVERGK